jgi:Domain of Unknown Function (DUF1206)
MLASTNISNAYRSVQSSAWAERWARFGFITGGVVYIITGIVAALVAFEHRGRIAGPEGAIDRIGRQPFGQWLLAIGAVGLLGYALWCFTQALWDTDHDGRSLKGIAARTGQFCSGLAYLALAIFAFHRMFGSTEAADQGTRHWTARLLAHTWGVWLVAFIGIVLIGAGIAEVVYGLSGTFRQYLRLGQVSWSDRDWITQIGTWGYVAQGVVLSLVGALVVAAVHSNPRSAVGLDGALRALAEQPFGPWLMAVVALGLASYGVFMLIQARFRKLS